MMIFRSFYRASLYAFVLVLALAAACSQPQAQPPDRQQSQLAAKSVPNRPKVLILLVDSLLAPSIDTLAAKNQVPALSFLIQNGKYRRDAISSFPTMSVTIDSTLLTGTYADQHRIPGLLWFHPTEKRMVNYGDGARVALRPGLPAWFTDSVISLNNAHLSPQVQTLHEALHERGFSSASINGLVYRGKVPQTLSLPFGLSTVVKQPETIETKGPNLLGIGALHKVTATRLPDAPAQKYGFTTDYAVKSLIAMIKEGTLPDVTLVYLPDMDGDLHKHGPGHLEGVVRLDRQLQQILNAFGDWRNALQNHLFLVMGDSGGTATGRDAAAAEIDLEQLLQGYQIYRAGRTLQEIDDVAIAVNGRMAYVYALSPRVSIRNLVNRLSQENRIDLVAWREADWIHVAKPGEGKTLAYRPGKGLRDPYGGMWEIRGDWSVMQLERREQQAEMIDSKAYPDGLKRLASVFASHEGEFLVVAAKPGTELSGDGSPIHVGGGNHGSLDRSDALFPVIVAGRGKLPAPPERMVEMKAYILQLVANRNAYLTD